MSLTLQDLQDITAICQAGSFRKAAVKLGVTQPTLSSRVALMERRLGAELFERARGRSRPTQLALTISTRAGGLLDQVSGLVNEVQRVAEGAHGLVRMGFGPVPAFSLLLDVIREVDASIPGATLIVQSGSADQLLDMLSKREIDLAVCAGGAEFTRPELHHETLLSAPVVAVLGHGHPLAAQTSTSMRQLFQYPVALPLLDRHYQIVGVDAVGTDLTSLPDTVFCSDYWLLESLVETGRYATLCPRFSFAEAAAAGRLVALPLEDGLVHEIWLYTNLRSLPLPAVERVIRIIRKESMALSAVPGGPSR